jgi:hypothetical protein
MRSTRRAVPAFLHFLRKWSKAIIGYRTGWSVQSAAIQRIASCLFFFSPEGTTLRQPRVKRREERTSRNPGMRRSFIAENPEGVALR